MTILEKMYKKLHHPHIQFQMSKNKVITSKLTNLQLFYAKTSQTQILYSKLLYANCQLPNGEIIL